jgi:hypothetical protein
MGTIDGIIGKISATTAEYTPGNGGVGYKTTGLHGGGYIPGEAETCSRSLVDGNDEVNHKYKLQAGAPNWSNVKIRFLSLSTYKLDGTVERWLSGPWRWQCRINDRESTTVLMKAGSGDWEIVSPEFDPIDPGDPSQGVRNTPAMVSGVDQDYFNPNPPSSPTSPQSPIPAAQGVPTQNGNYVGSAPVALGVTGAKIKLNYIYDKGSSSATNAKVALQWLVALDLDVKTYIYPVP